MNSTTKTVDALMKLDMPAGVDIEIKTQELWQKTKKTLKMRILKNSL